MIMQIGRDIFHHHPTMLKILYGFDGQSNVNGNMWKLDGLYESPQKSNAWISTEWSRNEDQTVGRCYFYHLKRQANHLEVI